MTVACCPDFPQELSKLSLTEQPSPLYCEQKADLWRHINETELEEEAADSTSYCSPFHQQLSVLSAASPGYLSVMTHAGPLMIVQPELSHFSRDDAAGCSLESHNISIVINDGGTGCQSDRQYQESSVAVNEAVSTANFTDSAAGTVMYKPSSVSCRQQQHSALTPVTNNTPQPVSHFTF